MSTDEINAEIETEEPEGLDTTEYSGWGDYPLDSVFVRKDQRTVVEIMGRIEKKRYVLDPEFQRDFVWSPQKQSRLIESCLMRIPLPVFYVAEAKDGRIIVVDGLQRLTTFYRYLNNSFALTGLGDGYEASAQDNPLLNKKFKDLPLHLKERLEDTQLTLYILDAKAPERAKLDIFERVNGGEPLTRQQMRNCLFNGSATRWLREAAESPLFIKVTGRSLNRKTMRDREAINRFCAFKILGIKSYKADMDAFLATTLEKMNVMSTEDLDDLKVDFEDSLRINHMLFGKHSFRKSLSERDKYASRTVINLALFDVCSVLFSEYDEASIKEFIQPLRNSVSKLLCDDQFIHAITYATNGLRQSRKRFEMMELAIEEVLNHDQ